MQSKPLTDPEVPRSSAIRRVFHDLLSQLQARPQPLILGFQYNQLRLDRTLAVIERDLLPYKAHGFASCALGADLAAATAADLTPFGCGGSE